MKWFKHYTNAHKGSLLQDLYGTFGINEGYGLYFRFTEFLAEKWDGVSDPKFRFLTDVIRRHLALSPKKFQIFAEILTEIRQKSGGFPAKNSEISFKISGKFCEIYFPKLLEIRHRDAFSASTRLEISQHETGGEEELRIKKEEKEEEESASAPAPARDESPPPPPLASPLAETGTEICSLEDLLAAIPVATKKTLVEECKDYGGTEFVKAQIADAFGYYAGKPDSHAWNVQIWISKIKGTVTRNKVHADRQKAFKPAFVPSPTPERNLRARAAPPPFELPYFPPKETLSNAHKLKLGSGVMAALVRGQVGEAG